MWCLLKKKRLLKASCCWVSLAVASSLAAQKVEPVGNSDIEPFVEWLLDDPERLESIPFSEVVRAVSDKRVLPVDSMESVDAALLAAIELALADCLEKLNTAEHSIHTIGRVNEVSRPIEDFLQQALDAVDGLECRVPITAEGEAQRSGYPDLRLLHVESGRVFYIDPKVYKSGSERSGFRTFYFEPKLETNKILDDASHVIVGIAHGGKVDGRWQFQSWRIVDLAGFRVRLKAEFQASNKDLYQEAAIIGRSDDAR